MSSGLYTSYRFDDCTFPTPTRLSDDEYDLVLQNSIRVCADIVLFNQEKGCVYLAKRKICFPEWWIIGGQIWPGESEVAGAQRCLKRETSLQVTAHRLRLLCLNRYMHAGLPKKPARDNLAFVFSLNASELEVDQATMNLDPTEYNTSLGLMPFNRKSLSADNILRPIADIYSRLFPR